MPAEEFRAAVLSVVDHLAPGEVASYGDVAAQAGYPGAARAAGSVLASLTSPTTPWWRVVYADGRLAPGHEALQAQRLAAEGVDLIGYRVHRSSSQEEKGVATPAPSARRRGPTGGRRGR